MMVTFQIDGDISAKTLQEMLQWLTDHGLRLRGVSHGFGPDLYLTKPHLDVVGVPLTSQYGKTSRPMR